MSRARTVALGATGAAATAGVALLGLEAATARLRDRGAAVVVGTCPDLGALRPVPQPLRTLGGRLSGQLADAQATAALRAGARPASLRRAVGPVFISQPRRDVQPRPVPSERRGVSPDS